MVAENETPAAEPVVEPAKPDHPEHPDHPAHPTHPDHPAHPGDGEPSPNLGGGSGR